MEIIYWVLEVKQVDKSFRPAFSRAVNDNADTENLSEEALHRALNPPHNDTEEVLHGVTVKDPFRPLEQLDDPETAAWVQRQNKLFSDYLADSKETVKAAYLFLKKAKDYIYYGPPDRYGNKYFRGELTGLGRIEISDSARGPWKILLDPNKLAADGTLSLSEWTPSEDGKRIAYFISERGGSARTMRILDVETGKDLPDVIEYCNSKSILWDRNSHDGFRYDGYVYQDKKWLRLVMHHTIGQPVKEDSPVFKCPADAQRVKPYRLETARYEWIQPYVTNNVCGLLFRPFGSKATFKELSKPAKFSLDPVAECDDGSVLAVTNKDAPQGKLLSFNPGDPSPEKWRTIIPEQDGYILYKAIQRKDKLLAFYKHDAAEAIRVYSLGGKYLYDVPLPIQSMVELARDNTQDDKLLMLISSFKSKGDYYTADSTSKCTTRGCRSAA